jgi:hypothetical protein
MNKRLALLCVLSVNSALLAQPPRPAGAGTPFVPSHPELRRVLRRNFPPDVVVPSTRPLQVKSSRSYCVYPLLYSGSLSIEPCQKIPPKPHLVTPFQKVSAPIKPFVLPAKRR